MFRCEKCNKISKPREKMHKVITETREKVYENKIKTKNGESIKETFGTEIVKEISLCENCYKEEGMENE